MGVKLFKFLACDNDDGFQHLSFIFPEKIWISDQTVKWISFTSKFCYLFICNPSHNTETETAEMWETTNSKPLGPIIMIQ
jgi:hypothetical protein